jgi:hypothetical protein
MTEKHFIMNTADLKLGDDIEVLHDNKQTFISKFIKTIRNTHIVILVGCDASNLIFNIRDIKSIRRIRSR